MAIRYEDDALHIIDTGGFFSGTQPAANLGALQVALTTTLNYLNEQRIAAKEWFPELDAAMTKLLQLMEILSLDADQCLDLANAQETRTETALLDRLEREQR